MKAASVRAILSIALVVLMAIAGMVRADDGADVSSHPWIDTGAPEFKLETVNGEVLSLGDLRGKYVVVHFGTSW